MCSVMFLQKYCNLLLQNRNIFFNNCCSLTIILKISSKSSRPSDCKYERPKPYPYKKKGYNLFNSIFDGTTHRFDENSKIICVEGLPFSGKTQLSKAIADEFEMLFMPSIKSDQAYINSYGYDLRQLDHLLPESCQSFDTRKFFENPCHINAASFQIDMYLLKYERYIDSLIHLLNTGQGVVIDNSVYSDFIYMFAMYETGFISSGAKSVYEDVMNSSLSELMYPHLFVYLHVDVDEIKKRIRAKGKPYEQNSKLLTEPYFENMDCLFKELFLKQMGRHSELMIYDWNQFGDAEIVIEDIERINFDKYTKQDVKLKEWRITDEMEWNSLRINYTNYKESLLRINVARFDVPELLISPEESKIKVELYSNAPGMKYEKGFNKDQGDKNILFKF